MHSVVSNLLHGFDFSWSHYQAGWSTPASTPDYASWQRPGLLAFCLAVVLCIVGFCAPEASWNGTEEQALNHHRAH